MIINLPFPTLRIDPVAGGPGLWLDSMDSFDPVESTDTEYRPTFAGSMRAFVSPVERRSFRVSCTLGKPHEDRWLKDHRAVHCLFRFEQWRVFGMYEKYGSWPYQVGGLYRIDFTVTEVTHIEAV